MNAQEREGGFVSWVGGADLILPSGAPKRGPLPLGGVSLGRFVNPRQVVAVDIEIGSWTGAEVMTMAVASHYWVAPRVWVGAATGLGVVALGNRDSSQPPAWPSEYKTWLVSGSLGAEVYRYDFSPGAATGRLLVLDMAYEHAVLPGPPFQVPAVMFRVSLYSSK